MTTKHTPDQAPQQGLGRAVWLAALPGGRSVGDLGHSERRVQAKALARTEGAEIVGELVTNAVDGQDMTDAIWSEVLDFIRERRANLLVVLRPEEIAPAVADYQRRTRGLAESGIWHVDGADRAALRCAEESRAA